MSKKKKITKEEKEKRRVQEAEKASVKSRMTVTFTREPEGKTTTSQTSTKSATATDDKYSLPIAAIKRDLVKNGLYMAFVIIVLAVLKITNFTL